MPEIRYARNGDVHLANPVRGHGSRDLVLVPGFTSHLEVNWNHPAARGTHLLKGIPDEWEILAVVT